MTRCLLGLLLLVALAACGPQGPALEASDAWVRAAEAGANTAAYFTLHNAGSVPDRLGRASAEGVRAVEIHESIADERGVVRMRRVEAVDVGAGQTLSFEPGGFHVMLIGLERALEPGETIALTLHFDGSGEQRLEAEVRGP